MKVLAITPYLASTYGGTSKCIQELANEVSNLDISLDLVTTNAALDSEKLGHDWIRENNYRIKYFPCWYRNDFIISLRLVFWLLKNANQYDLVHTNTVFAPLISVANFICHLKHIPYINTPHGMLEPWALSYKARKKKYYYQWFEKPLLANAEAIQTLASSEAEKIQELGFEQTVTIPNGIHVHDYQNLPSAEIFYQQFPQTRNKTLILFLGRIDPKKGLDLLAPAFAKVHQDFPETHLIMAGPDSIGFMPTVTQYFQNLDCMDAVTFTGMLKGDLKLSALAAANLYVAPSYSEGFSVSVLEGMASGLPCVITTGCNFPEAAQVGAARVVEIDSESIATALLNLLENPQSAQKMGEIAQNFIADNYTWKVIGQKMVQTYRQVVNG